MHVQEHERYVKVSKERCWKQIIRTCTKSSVSLDCLFRFKRIFPSVFVLCFSLFLFFFFFFFFVTVNALYTHACTYENSRKFCVNACAV